MRAAASNHSNAKNLETRPAAACTPYVRKRTCCNSCARRADMPVVSESVHEQTPFGDVHASVPHRSSETRRWRITVGALQ